MAKISIITICYNEPNLERTCESIVNQTFQDFEWIVVDGGSNQETQEIWNRYKDRIDKFISEPDNGRYDAMNKGISLATGEYLNFMNAGDYFADKDVLQNVVNKNLDKDIVFGDLGNINTDGSIHHCIFPDKVDLIFLYKHFIPHQASFIKADLFDKYGHYSTEFLSASDWEKWIVFIILNHCTYKHIRLTCCIFDTNGISSKQGQIGDKEREIILHKYFSEEEILKLKNSANFKLNFLEKIFSIKKCSDNRHIAITFMGFTLKTKGFNL